MCTFLNAYTGVQDLRGYHIRVRCIHCGAYALALHCKGGDFTGKEIEYEEGEKGCSRTTEAKPAVTGILCSWCGTDAGTDPRNPLCWNGFLDKDNGKHCCWNCQRRHYQEKSLTEHKDLFSEFPVIIPPPAPPAPPPTTAEQLKAQTEAAQLKQQPIQSALF